jgi:hypothetical protein
MSRLNILTQAKSFCLLAFIPALLCGCIILPLHSSAPEPFSDSKKDFAIAGQTTKTMVIEKLGKPLTTRLGERIYVYAAGQKDWEWGGVVLIPGGLIAGSTPTYKTHLLIFEFGKDEIVTAVCYFCGDAGEIQNGFYIVNSGSYTAVNLRNKSSPGLLAMDAEKTWFFRPRDFILCAPKEMDKQAKTYLVPSNKAVIYYYKKFSTNVEVALDGELSGDPGNDGFLMWIVNPGDHTVNCPWRMGRLTLSCFPGEKYYLEHKDENGKIRLENELVGEKELRKRNLVVERLNALDFD